MGKKKKWDYLKTIKSYARSVADPVTEIKKYKELLDFGAITAEEFAAKKQQLLGI